MEFFAFTANEVTLISVTNEHFEQPFDNKHHAVISNELFSLKNDTLPFVQKATSHFYYSCKDLKNAAIC